MSEGSGPGNRMDDVRRRLKQTTEDVSQATEHEARRGGRPFLGSVALGRHRYKILFLLVVVAFGWVGWFGWKLYNVYVLGNVEGGSLKLETPAVQFEFPKRPLDAPPEEQPPPGGEPTATPSPAAAAADDRPTTASAPD